MCSLDPTKYDYWIGLGHSSFQVSNYQQAIRAYSMAAGLDPENIWPHVWAANCFEEEHDFEFAKMALNEALTLQKTKMPKNIELIQNLEARIQKIQTK
jgi:tetratricopeptide (TPR) repeat protein